MPTRWTQTLIPTTRHAPADAEVPSHQLLLRAGYVRKLGSGSYSYLPLGLRSLHKAIAIVREEMDAAGAAEVFLPTLQPVDLWQRTGRRDAYGQNLFVVTDRHGREQALGPTHEEVVTDLLSGCVESYKDLPKTVYQVQTKFRDEFRPRFGVLRSREFYMKDAYSFHCTQDGEGGLDAEYQNMYDAYCRIFDRCGVPYLIVEAEAGPIGGDASHEFMVPSPTGEDTILMNENGYAANVEKAQTGPRPSDLHGQPTGDLETVHTPGCPGIDDVCAFFKKNLGSKLAPRNMLKTLVCRGDAGWVLAVVRGDHELNEAKLRLATSPSVALADEAEARAAGFAIGFVGPHVAVGRDDVTVVVDPDAAQGGFWVTGANEPDRHVKHFNWKRELGDEDKRRYAKFNRQAVRVADLRNAVAGDPAPPEKGGGTLTATKGIEVGHVFKLGTKYTQSLGVTVRDEHNQPVTPLMGCYGIGVNRILAAAIESEHEGRKGHDDHGILWPRSLAPYDIVITTIKFEGDAKEAACGLASQLEDAGYEVLIDDRDERPGVKFKDADLIGVPVRVTVGDKGLSAPEGPQVEVKARNGSNGPKGELVPLDAAPARVAELLDAM
ncbi:MAG: proline--tRNA ligase [Planctomycetota bacterium]